MDGAWPKIADAFMGPGIGPQLEELNIALLALRPAAGRPVLGWYQYFDRDIKRLLGKESPARSQNALLRQGQAEGLPDGDLGRDRRRRRRARPPSRAPRTRPRGAPSATAEQIAFAPGLLPTRCATRTGRAGSSR